MSEQHPLHDILNAKSIAFLGASNNPTTMGTVQMLNLISGGFEGRVYPVHPKEKEVLGLKAYEHVADLPETPELYVHRIGRTARAGAEGVAVSFCAGDERGLLKQIEHLTKCTISVEPTIDGFEPTDPIRRDLSRGRQNGGGGRNGYRPEPSDNLGQEANEQENRASQQGEGGSRQSKAPQHR